MTNVAVFTGTRADFGLLYWIIKDLQSSKLLNLQLLVSGSHLSPEFGNTIKNIEKEGFEISEKVEILLSSDSAVGMCKSMGLGLIGYGEALSRINPDMLLVLGDRYEALAVAQSAMLLNIPILHFHGGEITNGAVDEMIRHAITKLSFLHFTSCEEHRNRVIQMGETPDRVFNVGALGLESINKLSLISRDELSEILNFDLTRPYFLLTYHPVTLGEEDPVVALNGIFKTLENYPDCKLLITYPNVDSGSRLIIPLIENYALENANRVVLVKSLGQVRYLSAAKHAEIVMGNSSSGIIEVPSLHTPTINIGIRQSERLCAKSVIHCDIDEKSIGSAINLASAMIKNKNSSVFNNPYGDGNVSCKVLKILENYQVGSAKTFYDLE